MTDRIIALIDMDCFYVQVEQRLNPSLKGKPCAVVQYNAWKGGGIIAVGYEARAHGVTRPMRGDDAKVKCPEIQLIKVPEARGKADLTRYREAGAEVLSVFSKYCSSVERASVDEAYLDVTVEVTQRLNVMMDSQIDEHQIPNTFIEGFNGPEGRKEWIQKIFTDREVNICEIKLAVAASLVEEMRAAVFRETGFTCSSGIAHNKMLAKLACGRNKPNKQTVLPHSSVPTLFSALPLTKIRHLGGKLGASLLEMGLKNMSDILPLTEEQLHKHFGSKTGTWLYNACRGLDFEPVSIRELPKSIGCSKQFGGQNALDTKDKIKFWLSELAQEVCERLTRDRENNNRVAKCLTVYVGFNMSHTTSSRACALVKYDAEKIASDAFAMLKQFNTSPPHSQQWSPPFTYMGLSTSRFSTLAGDHQKIDNLFAASQSGSTKHQKQSQLSDPPPKGENVASSTQSCQSTPSTPVSRQIQKSPVVQQYCDATTEKKMNIQSFFSQMVKKPDEKQDSAVHSDSVTLPISSSPKGFFARKMKTIRSEIEVSAGKKKNLSEKCDVALKKSCDNTTETNKIFQSSVQIGSPDEAIVVCNIDSDGSVDGIGDSVIKSPPHHEQTNSNSGSSEDFMTCEKCGRVISMWDMPEHTDYHFALDLQKESSRISGGNVEPQVNASKRKLNSPSKNVKGGKKKKAVIDKTIRPLTMFFSKH
ncbi:hypothetical protein Btru_049132 [Bulinus truncatus]|nr:hypothetical protein Btru_049132 [Bulinus truncatus]